LRLGGVFFFWGPKRNEFVTQRIPRALTVAGSDSGGGAGIQADLKTFAALGVYGTCAITALTAQNTRGVAGVHAVPAKFVELQIATVLDDIGADAVKTGMLANREIVLAVARAVERYGVKKLVVDPVLMSKHGAALLADDALDACVEALFPLALVVTPNVPEAERLVGFKITDGKTQRQAARAIARLGPRCVLVKGGHLADSESATDVLFDGHRFQELTARRIDSIHTHGTGCTLSAAIAGYLALGCSPLDAVARAKRFVTHAIEQGMAVGKGIGAVNPMSVTGPVRRNSSRGQTA
jgi:hydroxymethylpyrimidine/phosphomethylpyrimidine kinase